MTKKYGALSLLFISLLILSGCNPIAKQRLSNYVTRVEPAIKESREEIENIAEARERLKSVARPITLEEEAPLELLQVPRIDQIEIEHEKISKGIKRLAEKAELLEQTRAPKDAAELFYLIALYRNRFNDFEQDVRSILDFNSKIIPTAGRVAKAINAYLVGGSDVRELSSELEESVTELSKVTPPAVLSDDYKEFKDALAQLTSTCRKIEETNDEVELSQLKYALHRQFFYWYQHFIPFLEVEYGEIDRKTLKSLESRLNLAKQKIQELE